MRSVIIGSWPWARSSAQRAAVRRSCQTMARAMGSPVLRSQTSVVSRWLVMPMAAMSSGLEAGAFDGAAGDGGGGGPDVGGVVLDPARTAGSAGGTPPARWPTIARLASNSSARLEVVPWSMARMWVIAGSPRVAAVARLFPRQGEAGSRACQAGAPPCGRSCRVAASVPICRPLSACVCRVAKRVVAADRDRRPRGAGRGCASGCRRRITRR